MRNHLYSLRYLLPLMIMVGLGVAWGGDVTNIGTIGSTHLGTYTLSGSCQESLCSICEKKISQWQQPTYSGIWTPSGSSYCGQEPVNQLSFYKDSRFVCLECTGKYKDEYQKSLSDLEKSLFNKFYLDAADRRKVQRDKNKAEALKNLLEQAKEIERKLKELEKKP